MEKKDTEICSNAIYLGQIYNKWLGELSDIFSARAGLIRFFEYLVAYTNKELLAANSNRSFPTHYYHNPFLLSGDLD